MPSQSSPFFSIIIPVYNREKAIIKALNSIENQKFKNFETIVVDDCSSDNSFTAAQNHPLANKTVFRNEVNSERCHTRNNGIFHAKGEYICFLDSDDYHLDFHLQELFDRIEKENFPKAVFFSNSYNETFDGQRSSRVCPNLNEYPLFSYLMNYTPNPQRWAIHKDILKEIQFDPEIVICEDLDILLRIAASKYPFYQIAKPTTVYVASLDSFTHGDNNKAEKELLYYKKIFKKNELTHLLPQKDKNLLISKCYFLLNEKFKFKNPIKSIFYGIYSFWLYPKGYNGNNNKILFVNILYAIPFLGYIFRKITHYLKK